MKNIHVIGTNEPSRLFRILAYNYIFDKFNKFSEEYKKLHGYKNKHIYITNDEVIKEGDWHLKNDKMVTKSHIIDDTCKKIILTTDQELIKDGLQPINDTFLEWYVHNQSCEYVEIEDWYNEFVSCCISKEQCYCFRKRIIIPHENLEQKTLEQVAEIFYSQESKLSEDDKWQHEKIKEYFKKAYLDGHELCRNVTDNTDQAEEYFEQWFSQYGIKYDL
jgi:hypothetical protein